LALTQAEFSRLVRDHGTVLFRMAYRMCGDSHEAEDLVQEAFSSAWKGRSRFDSARGERAWLVVILRRRAADRWRGPRTPSVLADDGPLEIGVTTRNPLEDQYTDEMQHALDLLPNELRDTLLLVVVGELTHQEAADVLGVPLGTVLSRVSRARNRLRDSLLAMSRRT
jgi:RNA polymerase sigma-70 factor (ECF subfamily)